MAWWWSLTQDQVEDDSGPTVPKDRLGPYDTPEQAAQALRLAAERTEAEDERDRRDDG